VARGWEKPPGPKLGHVCESHQAVLSTTLGLVLAMPDCDMPKSDVVGTLVVEVNGPNTLLVPLQLDEIGQSAPWLNELSLSRNGVSSNVLLF
jgi:hypothetical protein